MDMLHTPNPMAITSTEEIKVATFQLNCASGGDEYHKFVYRMCALGLGENAKFSISYMDACTPM